MHRKRIEFASKFIAGSNMPPLNPLGHLDEHQIDRSDGMSHLLGENRGDVAGGPGRIGEGILALPPEIERGRHDGDQHDDRRKQCHAAVNLFKHSRLDRPLNAVLISHPKSLFEQEFSEQIDARRQSLPLS